MKNLLKAIVVVLVLFSFSEAKAQISVGAGAVFGTEINNLGISVHGKYQFTDEWSAAPSFTYFLKKDNLSWSSLDLDANYQISDAGLYLIGGLNMTFFSIDTEGTFFDGVDLNGTDTGFNVGAGMNFEIGDGLTFAPEARYTLGGGNFLRIGLKIMIEI